MLGLRGERGDKNGLSHNLRLKVKQTFLSVSSKPLKQQPLQGVDEEALCYFVVGLLQTVRRPQRKQSI